MDFEAISLEIKGMNYELVIDFTNFFQKSNEFTFVEITKIYSLTYFWQKFRESNVFIEGTTEELI